jgi:hypothetical protein
LPETFTPFTWADGSGGGTPITAAQLNRIETGLESMDDRVDALEDAGAGTPGYSNVRTLGAVGDDFTDDTNAFQTALTAGGLIYVPPGTYRINATLNLTSDTVIFGAGMNRTVIRQMGTASHGLFGSAVRRVAIRDLWLRGPSSGTGDGIRFVRGANPNVPYIVVENVQLSNWGQDGISIENGIVSQLTVINSVSNLRYGYNIYGTGGSGTSVACNACYGNANTTAGHRWFNMAYSALTGCAADSNPTGYLIDSCQGIALLGCGAESNTTSSFTITGGSSHTLVNPRTYDHRGTGINITGNAQAVTITNAIDATPNAAATSFITVNSGSRATLIACRNTTANSLAAGTTTQIDQTGNVASPGNLAGSSTPGNHNLIAWSYDMAAAASANVVTNGTVYLTRIYVPATTTVTRLHWAVATAGGTPTNNQNHVGIYDSAGTRLATTNVDGDISSVGVKTTTITSQTLTGGSSYWVAFVFNAGTPPQLTRAVGGTVAASLSNVGLTASNYRYAVNGTSQTTLPTTITPASNAQGVTWWVAAAV